MFTGIIEKLGTVKSIEKKGKTLHLTFQMKSPYVELTLGESIAVNGVCLTVTKKSKLTFQVDVIKETYEATTAKYLKKGDLVNLERALAWGDRLGGHFVSGHVDGTSKITRIQKTKKYVNYYFETPKVLKKYIHKKGSVSLDGISLTVQQVKGNQFSVGLIPHTLKVTTLGKKRVGEFVNLEVDLLARYALGEKFKPRSFKDLFKTRPSNTQTIKRQKRLRLQGF